MSSFGECKLSADSVEKLLKIKRSLKDDSSSKKKLWKIIAAEYQTDEIEGEICITQNEDVPNISNVPVHTEILATQFHLSQNNSQSFIVERFKTSIQSATEIEDIEQLLKENLERNNGEINWSLFENLSDTQISAVINSLSQKLNITGVSNICKSMCNMNMEQKIKYMSILCTKLILPKLIEVNKQIRIMTTNLEKLTRQFPEDVQKLIYVPILNHDLKDATAVLLLMDSFDSQKYTSLLLDFLSHANEIKEWHLPLLQHLSSVKMDANMKERLIKMLLDKATVFSKNKDYAKFIISFCKEAAPFSDNEMNMLKEIAAVHGTALKISIKNRLKRL